MSRLQTHLEKIFNGNQGHLPVTVEGTVSSIRGQLMVAKMPLCFNGEEVIWQSRKVVEQRGQIISFIGDDAFIAPLGTLEGVSPGTKIVSKGRSIQCKVGNLQLGKVVDAYGDIIDGKIVPTNSLSVYREPPRCLSRGKIKSILYTGIAQIDLFLSIGVGQRVGLFAPAGLGKSTLLGMIAKHSSADVNVIALVGERGREVKEFVEDILGPEGLSKSVVVAATSDESAITRRTAAYTATTIAERFRDQGKNVLLLFDSLTRTARAIRDMNTACGEIPIRHGYTPGVYAELPKLVERAGQGEKGSITAIYSVLTNNELDLDPLSDEIKSLLDGHILLSQKVAAQGIWPAIDLLNSVSRLYPVIQDQDMQRKKDILIRLISRLANDKDFVMMGGVPDKELECAMHFEEDIKRLRSQSKDIYIDYKDSLERMNLIIEAI